MNTDRRIRVIIADDHAIVRMGIAALLVREPDIEVVGEAEDGDEAADLAAKLNPDVVIMDLMMPKTDGSEATRKIIQSANPAGRQSDNPSAPRILILTTYGSSNGIAGALRNGATGVLLKSDSYDDLTESIRRVAAGERVISPEIQDAGTDDSPIPELTERQRGILLSITRGFTNDDIASQFGISPNSVKSHLKTIFAKLGASGRSEAVAIALRRQLLKI